MSENLEKIKYEFDVPYNNEVMVADRKKVKLTAGVVCIIAGLALLAMTIWSVISNGPIWAPIAFGAFALLTLVFGVRNFCTIKPRQKDEDKTVSFIFYEYGLQIRQKNGVADAKTKKLEYCLYRRYKNKQFVANVTEKEDRFIFKIFTGTYNGAPQYASRSLPKSVLKEEELPLFIEFLKEKVEKDYKVKIKNNKDSLENRVQG